MKTIRPEALDPSQLQTTSLTSFKVTSLSNHVEESLLNVLKDKKLIATIQVGEESFSLTLISKGARSNISTNNYHINEVFFVG